MHGLQAFEQHLHDALIHLYDPAFWPHDIVWQMTGCDPHQGLPAVQAALIKAIEALKPAPDVPPNAHARRVHDLLTDRYVHCLTQEETAERLSITPRHLRREQREAIHALARRLWDLGSVASPQAEPGSQEEGLRPLLMTRPTAKPLQWLTQVREELASLQRSAPGAVANVGDTMRSVVELGAMISSRRDLTFHMGDVQPDLLARIHPSALRQILISAMRQLAQEMTSGEICLAAGREGEYIRLSITGRPCALRQAPDSDVIREILAVLGGSVEIGIEDGAVTFRVGLRSVDRVTVLVVDDNADLVHFFRRYTDNTRYRIVHVPQGQRVFEAIEASPPDAIVLDVLLPDVDGWELLARLQEHPTTRPIPTIICSVIKEEDLASALGAALYLPKPVGRRQFLQALDEVLSRAPREEKRAQGSNAATC